MSKTTAPGRQWTTPAFVPRENIIERSQAVLAGSSIAIDECEDIFRVSAVVARQLVLAFLPAGFRTI